MKPQIIINIFDTSFEGYGVGRLENGSIVFVPDTVTGDKVSIEIVETKKSFSYGKLIDVIEPSHMRIQPPCSYAAECGGCQFMHIRYEDQIKIKKDIILNAFRKMDRFEINEIIFAEPERYRLRVRFKVRDGQLGFFAKRSNRFIPIKDCLLVKPSIVGKGAALAQKIHGNSIRELYLIENSNDEALATVTDDAVFHQEVVDGIQFGRRNVGPSHIAMETDSGAIRCGYTSFFQANRYLLSQFQSAILPHIDSSDQILELYAGAGFFTAAAARQAKSITALEYEGESIRLAEQLQLPNATFMKGNVDKLIERKSFQFNTLLVDPPRAGLSKSVIRFIERSTPDKIIYISCNPMTMARDIQKLQSEYSIEYFTFFDMFPHTFHIESMAVIQKKVNKLLNIKRIH